MHKVFCILFIHIQESLLIYKFGKMTQGTRRLQFVITIEILLVIFCWAVFFSTTQCFHKWRDSLAWWNGFLTFFLNEWVLLWPKGGHIGVNAYNVSPIQPYNHFTRFSTIITLPLNIQIHSLHTRPLHRQTPLFIHLLLYICI